MQSFQTDAYPALNSTALMIDAAIIAPNATAVSVALLQVRLVVLSPIACSDQSLVVILP